MKPVDAWHVRVREGVIHHAELIAWLSPTSTKPRIELPLAPGHCRARGVRGAPLHGIARARQPEDIRASLAPPVVSQRVRVAPLPVKHKLIF